MTVPVGVEEGVGKPWENSSNPIEAGEERSPGAKGQRRPSFGPQGNPTVLDNVKPEDGHVSTSAKYTLLPGYAQGL